MPRMILVLFTFIFFKTAFGQTLNGPYSYSIKIFETPNSCEVEAQNLVHRFRWQSGYQATAEGSCRGLSTWTDQRRTFNFFVLDVTYSLPPESLALKPISSYYGRSIRGANQNNLEGIHSSLKECLNDLERRSQEFVQHSGSELLAATCERAALDYKPSYVIRLDTLGAPKVPLHVTENLQTLYLADPFKKSVEKMIRENQGTVVEYKDSFYYYYAPKKITPLVVRFGGMRKSECQTQLQVLEALLGSALKPGSTLGCPPFPLEPDQFSHLSAVLNNQFYSPAHTVHEFYSNFSECERDKEYRIQQIRQRGQKVRVALCRINEHSLQPHLATYRMDLY